MILKRVLDFRSGFDLCLNRLKTVISRIKIAFLLCSIWTENSCGSLDFL